MNRLNLCILRMTILWYLKLTPKVVLCKLIKDTKETYKM